MCVANSKESEPIGQPVLWYHSDSICQIQCKCLCTKQKCVSYNTVRVSVVGVSIFSHVTCAYKQWSKHIRTYTMTNTVLCYSIQSDCSFMWDNRPRDPSVVNVVEIHPYQGGCVAPKTLPSVIEARSYGQPQSREAALLFVHFSALSLSHTNHRSPSLTVYWKHLDIIPNATVYSPYNSTVHTNT